MLLEVIDRAAEVRCYQCGSTDVQSVCHHCSRPMCGRHGSVAVHERGAGQAAGIGAPGSAGESAAPGEDPAGMDTRPVSREFAGLKLPPVRAAVHHCQDHDHKVGWINGIAAAGSVVRRRQTPAHELPPLPVFPDVHTATVVERLSGEVQLTDAGYVSTPRPVEGEIVIGMTHARARWQETMGRYRKRHQLPEDYPVQFAAGFALLCGKAGLIFDAGQDAILPDGLGLAFYGDVNGHDLFDDKRGRPQGEWELSARYRLQPARAPQDIPLWIVPSLGPTSNKQVLMIDVHWNMPEVDGTRAELNQFDLIEFQVPHQWGNLQVSSPPGVASSAPAPGQPRIIRWRQYRPAGEGRPGRSVSGTTSRSLTLKLEFEKPILDVPQLSGVLRASFNRTLSGVTGMDFYLPGGAPVRYLELKPRTEVSIRFDVSLSGLRYQEHRAVPDASEDAEEDRFRPKSDEFTGVMPDYRTVVDLTNAISADGYYVKTVVETHPYHDSRARVFNRRWDITGRWYEGVFPINFIISLHGTEPENPVARAALGRTVAEVTVDGMFPNAVMKKKIEDKWDGLHARVTRLLAERAAQFGDPGPSVTHGVVTSSPSPSPLPSAFPPTPLGIPGPGGSSDPEVVSGEVIDERGEAAASGDQAALAAELQRQRRDLRLLLGESGLIGERTCRAAIDDVKAELRYLQQPDEFLAGPPDSRAEADMADLLRQRRGLRGKLIAGQLSEDFYSEEAAAIGDELKDLGWSQ
jgi:hypothetical protein